MSVRVSLDEISIWSGDSVSRLPSPKRVGITQPIVDLKRTKSEGREHPVLACLNWDNRLLLPLDWIHTISSLVLGSLNLDQNRTTGFPGSPACRWQIIGLLSLHNHLSQLLTTNHTYHTGYIHLLLALFLWRTLINMREGVNTLCVNKLPQHIQYLQEFYFLPEKAWCVYSVSTQRNNLEVLSQTLKPETDI